MGKLTRDAVDGSIFVLRNGAAKGYAKKVPLRPGPGVWHVSTGTASDGTWRGASFDTLEECAEWFHRETTGPDMMA